MRWFAIAVAAALAGAGLARAAGGDYAALAGELVERQQRLLQDIAKIERARRDLLSVRDTKAKGFELNEFEMEMEKTGKKDLHIFMERFRNDTLEVLDLLDRALGLKRVHPARSLFGKAWNQVVSVSWNDVDLAQIAAEISAGYGVEIGVRDESLERMTMSLFGDLSLAAVFEHIEATFSVTTVREGDRLWFVSR